MKGYDIIVIGAGAGGITAAVTAAGFKKRVLLIDRDRPGGECTWSGCVPSKALINEAKRIHTVRSEIKDFPFDSKNAMDHVHAVRERIYVHETPEALAKSGIDYLQGEASFKDARTLLVDGRELLAKKYIIATGSSPYIPSIDGLDSVPYLTNESIFNLERLPASIIILGGGPIAVEMAQAMNRLGTSVQLVQRSDGILAKEEKEFSTPLLNRLREEGVQFHLGAAAARVRKNGDGIFLDYDSGEGECTIVAEQLLVAIGRSPNLAGLGLDGAGIAHSAKGIEINDYLQTSQPHIFALGDVTGPFLFSHMANAQGIQAIQNAVLPFKKKMRYDHVVWVTFTDPELARAGMTEAEARRKHGDAVRVYEYDFNDLDRAVTKGATLEKMKVILDNKGRTLGVTILAERAGEMIGEAQLLKSSGMNFARLASVIHPYPTYGEVFAKIGKQVMVDNLLNNPLVKFFVRK